jgi:anti-sigma factor RsiW
MSTSNETLLTQAALDGELDAAGMLDFENRLAANASLAAEYGRLNALREAMRRELVKPVAPPALRQRIAAMAAPSIAPWAARALNILEGQTGDFPKTSKYFT